MDNNYMQQAAELLPLGVAYIKLLYNDQKEAAGYRILGANTAFEKMTARRKEEITDKSASFLSDSIKSAKAYWLSFCTEALQAQKTKETVQWVPELQKHLKVSATPAGAGELVLLFQENVQETLPEDFAALNAVFSNTRDAVALVECHGSEYRYLRGNALHRAVTGNNNSKGKRLEEIFDEKTAEIVRENYRKCIATQKAVRYDLDISHGLECNENKEPQLWQSEVIFLLSKGKFHYLIVFSQNVTGVRKIKKENESLTRRLKAMFEQHSAINLIYDPISGRIIDANFSACEFYGYSREELRRMNMRDINLLSPDQLKLKFKREMEGHRYHPAVPYRLKNGEIRFLDVYSSLITDEDQMFISSIIFDVTDRETYRSDLEQEKKLLQTTLQSIGDGVVTTDSKGMITSLNKAAQILTGWSEKNAQGKPVEEVFILRSDLTGCLAENPVRKVLQTGKAALLANHTELITRLGNRIPIADSAAPIKSAGQKRFGAVMVFRDVSREKEHLKQIEYLSWCDAMTGLYNRRYAETVMAHLERPEDLPLSVIMGDVNGLKLTNDVFGHKAGDALLCSVARLLKSNCRPKDIIVRWGGDEFVVFLPQTPAQQAEKIIRNIRETMNQTPAENGLELSLSLGCSERSSVEKPMETVMQEAEDHMYHQKLLDGKSYRNSIINTLLATLYEKSNETEEHSQRLEKYCHSIGKVLHLSSNEMSELSLLALLHDVGKVGIDSSVLKKPASLTPLEWAEMKRHPEVGYRIAQATPEISVISDLILHHHERWDGNGYPSGIKGEEIPLLCRILSVADAFDAMTSDRCYRKALSTPEAFQEIMSNSGSQFDPAIVRVFLKIMQKP